jgi:K+-sensing histidine kinase KdpD
MNVAVSPRPSRLDDIVEECLRDAASALAHKSLSVTRQIAEGLPDYPLDRTLMKEAVAILIGEAIGGSDPVARLRVTIKSNQNALMLSVKASGHGFNEVEREILFTGEPAAGTLARVRAIVVAHGGATWANGEAGRGTTYYISLPARGEDA